MNCSVIDAINNSFIAWLLSMIAGGIAGYMAKGLIDALIDQKVDELARRRINEIEVEP
jgi:hypothetical protein